MRCRREEAHRRNSVRADRSHGGFWMVLGAAAGQSGEQLLVPAEALGELRGDGVPGVGEPTVGFGLQHDLLRVADQHAVVVPGLR
jgi:hypothetical protein